MKNIIATFIILFGVAGSYATPDLCSGEIPMPWFQCTGTKEVYVCDPEPAGCLANGTGSTDCELYTESIPECASIPPNPNECPSCRNNQTYEIGLVAYYALPNCLGVPDDIDDYYDCGC